MNRKQVFLIVSIPLMLLSVLMQGYKSLETYSFINKSVSQTNMIEPEAVVGIKKSNQIRAEYINYNEIKEMVLEAIELSGGLGNLIQDGYTVILKPNLISAYDMTDQSEYLPPEVNGMTTDWRITKAVSEIVRELNPTGKIYILEGSANDNTTFNMGKLNYTPEYIPDVDDFIQLENESGGWKEYRSVFLSAVRLDESIKKYPDSKKPNRSPEFYLNRIYYTADVVISLPVLKNHSQSSVTGAIKNVGIGATPQNIYGGVQGDNHRFVNSTIDHAPYYLHQWIHDFYLCRPVDFVIMDGLQSSDNGPVGITGRNLASVQQNLRVILAGKDAIAVDAVASLIMGYDPEKVRHILYLNNSGAGCAISSNIRVNGTQVFDLKRNYTNGTHEDMNSWYTDFTPPIFSLTNLQVDETTLKVGISGDQEITKVEVTVDGKFLKEIGAGGFNDMEFDLSNETNGSHEITVYAYDKYLNHSLITENRIISDIEESEKLIEDFELGQNYPNPFNNQTIIPFTIKKESRVNIKVYDAAGSEVREIMDENKSPGKYKIRFTAKSLSSGIYYYRITVNQRTLTRSMLYLK